MAKFEVREVFHLASRDEMVLAGKISEGAVVAGMTALIWLDSQLFWSLPIQSVEYIDRVSVGESLVGLVCAGQSEEDAAICTDLCPPGSLIDVTEADVAA